jgi:hypothetical protein
MRRAHVLAVSLALAAVAPRVARAECPTATTTADLVAAIEQSTQAYAAVDTEAFRSASDRVVATVPCVRDGIARHLAAELHRHVGVVAFVAKDRDRATRAFSAARGIEETWRFPEFVVPTGHPIATMYEETAPPTAWEDVPAPAEGVVTIDGVESTTRPVGVPTVVQIYDANGSITTTAYVWPEDPWPAYAVGGGEAVSAGGEMGENRRSARPWWIGTGIAALTTGALYGASLAVHGQYENEDTPQQDLDRLRATNNALVVASGVGLGATIGLGTVALAVQF